ncbi:MAG TPA: hypothetical protein VFQ61_09920, partial [Polyangiaceae bacterium]|nr:hypothetical protein [Polyangiaceae bacterium]
MRFASRDERTALTTQKHGLDRRYAQQCDRTREMLACFVQLSGRMSVPGGGHELQELVCALKDCKADRDRSNAKEDDVHDFANAEEVRPRPYDQRTSNESDSRWPEQALHNSSYLRWQVGQRPSSPPQAFRP